MDLHAAPQSATVPTVLDVVRDRVLLTDWLSSPYIVCMHAAPPACASAAVWVALLELAQVANARGVLVSVELPADDPGWSSPPGRALRALCSFLTPFCFCAFGAPLAVRLSAATQMSSSLLPLPARALGPPLLWHRTEPTPGILPDSFCIACASARLLHLLVTPVLGLRLFLNPKLLGSLRLCQSISRWSLLPVSATGPFVSWSGSRRP